MDWHPTEDDLVLHYYREGAADDTVALDAHLLSCPSCTTRWREITATLALVDADDVPDPGEDFSERVWGAIQPKLLAASPRRGFRPMVILGTLAASLLLAVTSGTLWIWIHRPAGPAVATGPAASAAAPATDGRERVLLGALTDHFSRTEMLLVELLNAPDAAPAPEAFEQTSADDLVASGRLYRATAQQTGDVQFASVLDDLESVLVEVARSGRMEPDDLTSLRARIRDDALLFKVRAVTTEIHDRQQSRRR